MHHKRVDIIIVYRDGREEMVEFLKEQDMAISFVAQFNSCCNRDCTAVMRPSLVPKRYRHLIEA